MIRRFQDDSLGSVRPQHRRVAKGLENDAALLRKAGRSGKATMKEARAKAIRVQHAEKKRAD
jgi:hypothetical protein